MRPAPEGRPASAPSPRRSPALRPTPLADRYRTIRRVTEQLCGRLSAEDAAAQSMPDASPAKWHLAHTSWFFETFVLEPGLRGYRRFHKDFRVLFNSYYNTVGEQHPRPERGLLTRPALEEVLAYRAHVDRHLLEFLGKRAGGAPEGLVELGLQHEQQHQELILTDVKHLFSCNPLKPAYHDTPCPPAAAPPPFSWRGYDEGLQWIGHKGPGFSFDNERPRHRVFVEAFELASRPVINGEFLRFVEAGGYERPEWWLSDGWSAVRQEGWRAPLYWERRDATWFSTTLAGEKELREEEPVCHVSFYEADAFARWTGARLPSEEEWEVAAGGASVEGNFLESELYGPEPATAPTVAGVPVQLFGDVWEWTHSAYQPYPGYAHPGGALGEYNGKFMANQMVLRGGSCVTPRSHIRPTYRNFFPPGARWQFTGIRLARDVRRG